MHSLKSSSYHGTRNNGNNLSDCRMLPAINTLKKETLEATYEHVNRLLKEESGENYDNVKKFIEYDEKSNVFEKKIQTIIIDSLKIKEGIINGLLSDDIHIIRRVLKCNWFFEDALTPEFYKNSIFPNVSFSTRCKIINKLSRNIKSEAHAEELFEFIRCNYGNKYAEMFLPKCQAKFISNYITEHKPLFEYNGSIKILINICKRFPDIIVSYLQDNLDKKNSHINGNFSKVILFLAKTFPDQFVPFFEKYSTKMWFFFLGKKLTKSLLTQLKEVAKTATGFFGVHFKESVFLRNVTLDDMVDILVCYVRGQDNNPDLIKWTSSMYQLVRLANMRPQNERAILLETVFTKIYNANLIDHPEMWTRSFLESLSLDRRAHYIDKLFSMSEDSIMKLQLHRECEDSEREMYDIFLYLMNCKSGFSKMKELMSKMSTVKRREILLNEMIKNCVINGDGKALETVFQYILERHKNDNPQMITQVLYSFRYSWLKCHEVSSKMLNSDTWLLVEQMAALIMLNSKECTLYRTLMEECVRYRLSKNMDIQTQIRNMLKLSFIPFPNNGCLLINVQKPFSKAIFKSFYNEIFMMIDTDSVPQDVKENLLILLLQTLNKYNSHSRRNRVVVTDCPRLIREIDNLLKLPKYNSDVSVLVSELVKDHFFREKYATRLLQISLLPATLDYLLKNRPDYVINSMENILNDIFSIYGQFSFKKFLTSRTRFDFLNITSEMEKIISEKFKTSVSSTRKVNALKMYSHLAKLEDFALLVKEYIPDRDRLHLDKDSGEFLEIQVTVPQVIKNIHPGSKNFSLILNYMNSDFLRWVLPSFDSACFRSPTKMLLPMLKEIFPNKPVTVRKIILYKIRDFAVSSEKVNHFKNLWDREKHSSIRSVIFQVLSKNFSENPTREAFEIIKKCILEADELSIKSRPSFSSIPAQFLNEYTILLWKFSERIESYKYIINFRNELIKNFASQNIWVLSEDFCEAVIRIYLFDDDAKVLVQKFSCYYLISNPYSMSQKLNLILQLMKERRINYKSVKYFLDFLRELSLREPKRFVGIFEGILAEWPKIYERTKLFEEYLLLQFAVAYNTVLKNLNFDIKHASVAAEFGKEFRRIINEFPDYGCLTDIIGDKLLHFLRHLDGFNYMMMADNMLGDSFGPTEVIIAFKALPYNFRDVFRGENCEGNNPKCQEHYKSIVSKLKAANDDTIKIFLNFYFGRNLEDL